MKAQVLNKKRAMILKQVIIPLMRREVNREMARDGDKIGSYKKKDIELAIQAMEGKVDKVLDND